MPENLKLVTAILHYQIVIATSDPEDEAELETIAADLIRNNSDIDHEHFFLLEGYPENWSDAVPFEGEYQDHHLGKCITFDSPMIPAESSEKNTHTYIGKCRKCDQVIAMCVDEVRDPFFVARNLFDMAAQNLAVEQVLIKEARMTLTYGCRCQKAENPDQLSLLTPQNA
jgi:hypothetical protein